DDGYDDAYSAAFPVLKQYNMTATFYIVTGFVGHVHYMTWPQIEVMDRAGMEMAGHTVHHLGLPYLSPAVALREIADCRADLEQHLGHSVLDFAYPSGEFNQSVEQNVRRAG